MEHEFIRWLCRQSTDEPLVGPGDDAAVISWSDGNCVLTVDTLSDGTHFRLSEVGPLAVGRKAAAVNLSDLAAMAAEPVALLLSLTLPPTDADRVARGVWQGAKELGDRYGAPIVGGDTNLGQGPLVVSVTAVGRTTGTGWTRGDARPGDAIVVSGEFGGSILGHHLNFEPRFDVVQFLDARCTVHAATDVSDGLILDLSHICEASGCGAVVELDQIPIANAAKQLAKTSGETALHHACHDGEDFQLLLAIPPSDVKQIENGPVPLRVIGQFQETAGVFERISAGLRPLSITGYEHK